MMAVSPIARAAVLHFFCAFGLFQKGVTDPVHTQRTVMATLGREARFSCELAQHEDVHQVTWQKLLSGGKEKTVATCTKYLGRKHFRDNVEFMDDGLQNSSIIMRELTAQDEGCYRCLFTYPEGALTGTTCLLLYELHGPVLNVTESNSTEELLVSCSATARPAPNVTLLGHLGPFSEHSSTEVHNPNGTVTATVSAVLPRVPEGSTRVGCAARVLSSPVTEVFRMIPEVKPSSTKGFKDESNRRARNITVIIILSVTVACCCAAATVFTLHRKQRNHNRQSLSVFDLNEMPHTAFRDTDETRESSVTREKDQIRKRTPETKVVSSDPNPSPSTTRRLEI